MAYYNGNFYHGVVMRAMIYSVYAILFIFSNLCAKEQMTIVGSSTVYPFTSYVAEAFSEATHHLIPIVESTGTRGGIVKFCMGDGEETPDILNASRPMSVQDYLTCKENNVSDITEVMLGFDGIVIAESIVNEAIGLSKEHLFLALAKEVPDKEGKLIKNPYMYWNEIDAALPKRRILIYGPPTTSGTRDVLNEIVMEKGSQRFEVYGDRQGNYKEMRQDGVFIPSGENDALIVYTLKIKKDALGIFGFSFLENNRGSIKAASIDGVLPSYGTITSRTYPFSRNLYLYIKNSHRQITQGMDSFLEHYMHRDMIGKNGLLEIIGLVPMGENELISAQKSLMQNEK